MQLIQASLRPLPPRFGDGQYNSDVNPPPVKTGIVTDLASQVGRIPQDIDLIYDLLYTVVKGGYLDDSKYIVWSSIRLQLLNVRWKRSLREYPLCQLRPPSSRNSRLHLQARYGRLFIILPLHIWVISRSIARLMGLTTYIPTLQLR